MQYHTIRHTGFSQLHWRTTFAIAILHKTGLPCNITMLCPVKLHCVTWYCIAILHETDLWILCNCNVRQSITLKALCNCNITRSATLAPHNVFVGQCEICSTAFLVTPAMQCNAMQHNTTHPMDFSSFLQFSVTLQPNATQQNTYILWHSQCNATYLIRGRPPNIFLTCFKIIALLQFPGETAIHGIVDDKLGSFLVRLVGTSFTRGHLQQAAQRATTMSCQHQCEIVKSPNVFCCRKIVLCPLCGR